MILLGMGGETERKMDKAQEPMTYRQIKEYVEGQGYDFSADGLDAIFARVNVWSDYPDSMPWGVRRWLDHEVLPAIRRIGGYEWPANLDARCEFTVLQTGRYVTEPADGDLSPHAGLAAERNYAALRLGWLRNPDRIQRPGPAAEVLS